MLLVSELNKITINFIERVNAFGSFFLLFQLRHKIWPGNSCGFFSKHLKHL